MDRTTLRFLEHNPTHFGELTEETQQEVLKLTIGMPYLFTLNNIITFYAYSSIADSFFIKELKTRVKRYGILFDMENDTKTIRYINNIALQHMAYHINNLQDAYVFLRNFKDYMGGWDWLLYIEEIKQYIIDDKRHQNYVSDILEMLKPHIDKNTYMQLEFISELNI